MSEYFIEFVFAVILLFIAVHTAIKTARGTQLLQHKRDVFVEAIQLVDKHINAQENLRNFGGMFAGHIPLDHVPTEDINRVLSQLVMLSASNEEIVTTFTDFFGETIGGDILVKRGSFVNLLQKDLYKKKTTLLPERIPFYVNKTEPSDR